MKAIIISIKPQYLVNILNGKKTIEVRKNKALASAVKNLIKEYGCATIYVYCTKDNKKHLYPVALLDKHNKFFKRGYREDDIDNRTNYLNGKVVCSFKCYKVEEIFGYPYEPYCCDSDLFFETNSLRANKLLEKSCLTCEELENYLNDVSPYGYAIHISDLNTFDKPKELSEFKSYKKNIVNTKINGMVFETELDNSLIKAPQNFCYVEIPDDN